MQIASEKHVRYIQVRRSCFLWYEIDLGIYSGHLERPGASDVGRF